MGRENVSIVVGHVSVLMVTASGVIPLEGRNDVVLRPAPYRVVSVTVTVIGTIIRIIVFLYSRISQKAKGTFAEIILVFGIPNVTDVTEVMGTIFTKVGRRYTVCAVSAGLSKEGLNPLVTDGKEKALSRSTDVILSIQREAIIVMANKKRVGIRQESYKRFLETKSRVGSSKKRKSNLRCSCRPRGRAAGR